MTGFEPILSGFTPRDVLRVPRSLVGPSPVALRDLIYPSARALPGGTMSDQQIVAGEPQRVRAREDVLDADRTRSDVIAEALATGNTADLTPDSIRWFVARYRRLERYAVKNLQELDEDLSEVCGALELHDSIRRPLPTRAALAR